ncbi:NineTeen Complex (NTC) component [Coemansia sp. RSA 1822]|nr:NineTeen Complex (NTC) component [Coemansia sp. RSA 638]KAJ2122026.1 NineTeen Complex (NTC) component [Coemansia sp. RSA 720]KAJ2539185.1 NineTeen Complex (NTC) component [Coemansia sp. RSA 1853]KAJ2559927.1 NineTeen Complex (NTC) component [Coemansia sp. RSA 1822]
MARNEEKAQSMLNRFREAQLLEAGHSKPKTRRPHLASMADTLDDAERWRRDVIREISRTVTQINDMSLPDTQIRQLNDDINRLLRTKHHWDIRVLELGGPNYKKAKSIEESEARGARGYKYFGRAKDLPGVREQLEKAHGPKKNKAEIMRRVDAAYYGFGNDDELLEHERKVTEQRMARLRRAHDATLDSDFSSDDSD